MISPDTARIDTVVKTIQVPVIPVAVPVKKEKKRVVVVDAPKPEADTAEKVTAVAPAPLCVGELSIASELWGTFFVNGEKKGNAPTKLPLSLTCGDYVVRIETPTGKIAEKVVQVSQDAGVKARFRENDFK